MTGLALYVVLQASVLGVEGQNYADAYRLSHENSQPLVVLVGTDWCQGCTVMKQGVIPNLFRRGKLRNVQYTTVNADENPQLARRLMRGESIPQLIVFTKTPEGWKREQVIGQKAEPEVEQIIDTAVAQQAKKEEATATETETVNR
jgi:thioredoxin-like negative regulator of GroEL